MNGSTKKKKQDPPLEKRNGFEAIQYSHGPGEKNIKKKNKNIFGGMVLMLYICRNK
jgi:hypothetical protein